MIDWGNPFQFVNHAKPKTKHKLLKPFQFSHNINQIQNNGKNSKPNQD
jgi:hypothetical protein